jgi:hypothetical protein
MDKDSLRQKYIDVMVSGAKLSDSEKQAMFGESFFDLEKDEGIKKEIADLKFSTAHQKNLAKQIKISEYIRLQEIFLSNVKKGMQSGDPKERQYYDALYAKFYNSISEKITSASIGSGSEDLEKLGPQLLIFK